MLFFLFFLMYLRRKSVVPCKFQQRGNFQSRFSRNFENLSYDKTALRGRFEVPVVFAMAIAYLLPQMKQNEQVLSKENVKFETRQYILYIVSK